MLFSAFLHFSRGRLDNHFIRPTNVEESFLQPTSFQKQLPRNITMLFIPIFLRFLEHEKPETTPAKHPPSIFHNHALLPTFLACRRNISCQCIYRHRISHTKLMSIVISLLKTNVCKCGHFYNHITGLTHHCSCKSSSLPPRLNFSNLIHPSFFFAPNTIFPIQTPSSQQFVARVERSSSTSRPKASIKRDNEVALFLPAAADICLLNFNLSVGAKPTACTPHVLVGIIPARDNFLSPPFMQLLW